MFCDVLRIWIHVVFISKVHWTVEEMSGWQTSSFLWLFCWFSSFQSLARWVNISQLQLQAGHWLTDLGSLKKTAPSLSTVGAVGVGKCPFLGIWNILNISSPSWRLLHYIICPSCWCSIKTFTNPRDFWGFCNHPRPRPGPAWSVLTHATGRRSETKSPAQTVFAGASGRSSMDWTWQIMLLWNLDVDIE